MEQKKYLPVDGFIRAQDNPGAIVNTDGKALRAYKIQREAELRKNDEINMLKGEVSELKMLLTQILEKIK